MIDAEATEGVEYFPVKWLANQRRAISNHYKATYPHLASDGKLHIDLAFIYMALYGAELEIRETRHLPPIGALPLWVVSVAAG